MQLVQIVRTRKYERNPAPIMCFGCGNNFWFGEWAYADKGMMLHQRRDCVLGALEKLRVLTGEINE